MKNNTFLKSVMAFLCLSLSIFSCQNVLHDPDNLEEISQIPIQLSHRILSAEIFKTRMADNQFQQNDLIGLFLAKQSQLFAEHRHIDNALYTFINNEFKTGETYYYPEAKTPVKFFAYYPYSISGAAASSDKLNITIKSDQTSIENYSKSDFLTALTSNVVPTNKSVHLEFNHKLAKINFIVNPIVEGDSTLIKENAVVTVSNINTNAFYSLDSGLISDLSNPQSLKPYGNWEIIEKRVCGKKAILIPQDCSNAQIILSINGREFISKFPAINLQSGTSYNILLKFDSKIGITQISHQIGNWVEDNSDNEGALEEVFESQSINVQNINFDVSSVYDVVDEQKRILGTVCKEYLFNETIDAVALVYYNITTPHVGRILKTYGVDKTINSGTITWSNNSFSYQANETANEIATLFLNTNGDVITSLSETSPFISEIPNLLIDTRGEETIKYPIVKIGNQYWMREDLKTKRYNDGTSISNNTTNLSLKTSGYYENNSNIFYNDAAVLTNKLSTGSWTIPNENQWNVLINYIGNRSAKLKSGNLWTIKNGIQRPSNLTGFYAIPNGGYFENQGSIIQGASDHFLIYWKIKDSAFELTEKGVLISALLDSISGVNVKNGCGFSIRLIKK